MEFPEDLKYSKEHEWARRDGDLVRVGISDFAQDALGDVVYVDLPEVGAELKAGQPFGEVESTKSVSDLFAPISGTVVERNEQLADSPEIVNRSPYDEGWMVLVQPTDLSQMEALLDAAAYRDLTEKDSGESK
ncbi:MAG: glycine cleavage system protein GcvH [Actinomycetota bacterium]